MKTNLLAQLGPGPQATDLGPIGIGPGFGLFTADKLGDNPLIAITKVISTIIGVITISAGIWFLFQLLTGAFAWMISSGDKGKLTTAQDRMTHAVIGLIIVVAAYAITSVVGGLLGFDILNPQNLLGTLQLGGGAP